MSTPKRVLLVTETGQPSRYWESSLPILVATPIDLTFVSLQERGPLHEFVERLPARALALRCQTAKDYPAAIWKLAKIIRQFDFDIIHGNECLPTALSSLAGLFTSKAKRIFHRHHTLIEGKQALFGKIGAWTSHLTMACSESAAKCARECDGVGPSRVRVAYNGISPMRFVPVEEVKELRRKLKIAQSDPVISLVARLRKNKGHLTLIKASALLESNLGRKPHLLFIGDGPELSMLREHAEATPSAHVHFLGHQEDVAPWFCVADIVAIPSDAESFGLTALEAMSCEKPVVASNIGGLSEVIEDGVSGLLVEPKNAKALADAIYRLFQSREMALAIARSAKQRSLTFSHQAMVENWLRCYNLF